MAKAELRSRTSKAAKSSGKAPAARKRKPASRKSGKAFMLKGSQSDPTALAAPPKRKPQPAKRRPAPKAKAVTAPAVIPVTQAAPNSPQALVVWKKHGALDSLGYWLRSAGRDMMRRISLGRAVVPATGAPISAKLRTKNDLLREIAALRQENATLRDRLGVPQMPFGRQVADIF